MDFRTCVWSIAAAAVFLGIADVAAAPIGEQIDETKVVRIPSSIIDSVAGLGLAPKRALDYGTFVWLELSGADFDRLSNAGAAFQVQERPYTLRLGETSFDPLREEPMLPAAWKQNATDQPDLHLIQFVGPSRREWLDNLEANGLKIVQYIHPHTYIVWGRLADREAIGTLDESVRWTGTFEPGYRVHPRWRGLGNHGQDVKVLLYRGADTAVVIQSIERLGGQMTSRRVLNQTFEVVGFTLPGSRFRDAAGIPGVYSIQVTPTDGGLRGEMSDQINVNNFDGTNAAFPGYENWLTSVGLDGNGVIIANVDGGVQNNHPDLINRLIGCSGSTCGGGATDPHGTHTAGIMAADGSSGTTDGFGFLRGLGVAPGANLVEQVYNPTFTQPGGMLLLMTQSYNNGASLSGNSWGPAGTPRGYDNDTLQVDIGVRDADPNAAGNQPLTFVLSFMNGNGGTSSQGSPDEAKNIFTIGSTKMQQGGGAQILDINDVSANSAHGPALDGRTIPHMVAPGCSVDSSTSGSSYTLMCGTSMASPHVSGAVALFIEYYRNLP
ncbi:MAG: S8 family serine peptidase, partial [Planctomycetes bacterium]|nr:S8 family serine peptidase [Planctomycetota bacterium]